MDIDKHGCCFGKSAESYFPVQILIFIHPSHAVH